MEPLRVVIAYIDRGDRVLIGRRLRGQHARKWEWPGGKVEPGETDHAALERELLEELDCRSHVVGRPIAEVGMPDHAPPFTAVLYRVTLFGAPRARVHNGFMWVLRKQLRVLVAQGLMTPATAPLLNILEGK